MHQYSPPEGQGHLARAVLVGCLCLALYITWQAQQAEKYLTQAIQLALKFGLAEQSGDPAAATFKAQALDSVRAGIAVNPHYRRLTAEVAEPFAARGDWKNATWILESVASSRPNVPVIWKAIAAGYAHQGDHQRAEKAFQEVQRLRPDSFSTVVLRTSLLTLAGRTEQAAGLLHQQLSANAFDFELVQTAYAIGYKTQNWELAERSLEALIRTWPEQAADGYFRLGKLYTETPLQNPQKAIQAFKSGLAPLLVVILRAA
jgi:O-antigen ligase